MQSRDFCYWLQGFFELTEGEVEISPAQAAMIRRHLDLVFEHELAPLEARKAPTPPAPVVPTPVPTPVPPPALSPSPRPMPAPEPPTPVPAPLC